MRAIELTSMYLTNPIGIAETQPRLNWKAAGGKLQSGYEIRTWKNGVKDWESGKVDTASMYARYAGNVKSFDRITWSVRLYDEQGNYGEWSENQFFELGLLSETDWKAKWITGVGTDKEERLPADYYQKHFTLSKEVKSARLYITACGVYEAYVNGKKAGDSILAPGCTQYDKRLHYQTYDVTKLLSKENELLLVVGDGWFKGKLGCDGDEYFLGTQTKVKAQINIRYTDGEHQVIGTDSSFRWTNEGPVGYNDMKDGIHLDMTKELCFNTQSVETDYPVVPTASEAPPIREQEHFKPVIQKTPSGKAVLDFGQNIAGYVVCNICGKKNQKIVLHLGETLDRGEFTQSNFATLPGRGKSIEQKIEIICNGRQVPFYPKFFYSGFRYALVEGMDEVKEGDFTAFAIYSDISYRSSFSCSNESINRFLLNTVWSEKGNFIDIPTDCPQREKGGWTGDAQVFLRTAAYLSEPAAFFRKWLKDVRDCQREDGRVDNVCPKVQRPGPQDVMNGSVGWADAAVIIPYTLWKLYGDDSFITDNYELMHGWKEYIIRAASDKSIYQLPDENPMKQMQGPFLMGDSPYSKYLVESGVHWGEWCEPDGVLDTDIIMEMTRPKQEENAAYMHYSMTLLAEMLEAAGKQEEAGVCHEYAAGAREAYQYHFVKEDDIETNRQCKLVRPLALGLLDEKAACNVAARLSGTAAERDYKIGTGFLSTPFILPVLADYGYAETAYRMLENEEEPGWLAMVKQGATTVWEKYNGYDEQGKPLELSFNHYSPGAVCSFLFSHTAGIRIVGERKFLFRPIPGGSLNFAKAHWDSAYGMAKAEWKLTGSTFTYEIEVPCNCVAVVELPDGSTRSVAAGAYTWSCER